MIRLNLNAFGKELLIGAILGSIGFIFLVIFKQSPIFLIPTLFFNKMKGGKSE